METPLFPAFRSQFGGLHRRVRPIRTATLCQLEHSLGRFLSPRLLDRPSTGANSRDRVFSLSRTFWGFIWQMLTPHTSCREVVRQVQALFVLQGGGPVDESTGAYCQARKRMPQERMQMALEATVQRADRLACLSGRPIKVIDATSVQLPDTAANQKVYPQPKGQKPGCGFPVMQLVALFSLASGAIYQVVTDAINPHEMTLFQRLIGSLRRGDILLGDRAYGAFQLLAQLPQRGIDVVLRLQERRRIDFRRAKRLGPKDGLFQWRKGSYRPPHMSAADWKQMPQQITVRVVRFQLAQKGYRTKQVTLVTSLLDPVAYPRKALADMYRRRWALELCFRDLKTTMGMERLRCQSPDMVQKELLAYLIAHNLIRCLMAESARHYEVELERISFKGSVDASRQFSAALTRARNAAERRALYQELLQTLALDLVPHRPGRREPRAVKRRPKGYPRLTKPRHQYREILHSNHYRKSCLSLN